MPDNPLEPQGCAACEPPRLERFTEARAYVHTGMGRFCKGRQLTKTQTEPEPPPRAPLSVKAPGTRICSECQQPGHYRSTCSLLKPAVAVVETEKKRGQYICGNCQGVGHNARSCTVIK